MGILTNGKEWRLYFKEGRSSKFFEMDIEACLEDLQKFKYFYILFRPDAFIKDSLGRCLLDNIYDESLRFQEDIERNLREKVFKCVEWLGHGFLSREENHLSKKTSTRYTITALFFYTEYFLFLMQRQETFFPQIRKQNTINITVSRG